MQEFEIIARGKENGEGVVLSYYTTAGAEIFCLGVPLNYSSDEDWDLGPSWCYVIPGDKTTLIDTGQFGKFEQFKSMLGKAGFNLKDIGRVVVTHGHEDHDGNLYEVLEASGAELWAHFAFQNMISYHPGTDDGASHPEFPGSCRCCLMPDQFNAGCRDYHRKRSGLTTTFPVRNGTLTPGGDLHFMLTPGHSPDSICAIFQGEAFFSGDTLLPTITPHPSLMLEYLVNRNILPSGYGADNNAYGLLAYILSLHAINRGCGRADVLMPGHRLYEKGRVNYLRPAERAREIILFHRQRCENILSIMGNVSMGLEEISVSLFPPRLRKGYGKYLSQREVMSHLELLATCGDIEWAHRGDFIAHSLGSSKYRAFFDQFV